MILLLAAGTACLAMAVLALFGYWLFSRNMGTQEEVVATVNPTEEDNNLETPLETDQEYKDTWFSALNLGNLAELTTSNAGSILPSGRLGRGQVLAISPSPGGGQAALLTTTGISILDAATFKETLYIDEPVQFTGISYSPDGSRLAAGLVNGRVNIYDANTGDLLQSLVYIPTDSLYDPSMEIDVSVAYSPDGRSIAAGTSYGPVDLIDIASGEKQFSYLNNGDLLALEFGPDRSLAVCSKFIQILDGTTGEVAQSVTGIEGDVWDCAIGLEANSLAIGTAQNGIYFWDLNTRSLSGQIGSQELQTFNLAGLVYGRTGDEIVFYDNDGQVGSYNTGTKALSWLVKASEDPLVALGYTSGPEVIITGGLDKFIRLFSPADGREIQKLRSGYRRMGDVDFSPDGRLLAAGHEETINLWRMPEGHLQAELQQFTVEEIGTYGTGILAFSPNGINLAADSGNGLVNYWDIENNTITTSFKGGYGIVRDIEFLKGGDLLASVFDDPIVAIDNTSTGELFNEFEGAMESLAASMDGRYLAFSWRKDQTPLLIVYDLDSNQIVQELSGLESHAYGVGFNADGTLLAAGDPTGNFLIWDLSTGTPLILTGDLAEPQGRIDLLAFSPTDPNLLLTYNGVLRMWNVSNGTLIWEAVEPVWSLTFSPDGKLLVTSTEDGSIRLWGVMK